MSNLAFNIASFLVPNVLVGMQTNIYTPKLELGSETDSIIILSEGGGLSINIRPTSDINLTLLRQKAEEAGIKLYFEKEYSGGEWDSEVSRWRRLSLRLERLRRCGEKL